MSPLIMVEDISQVVNAIPFLKKKALRCDARVHDKLVS